MSGHIVSVASRSAHSLWKTPRNAIRLIAGFGVEGDAHFGELVQHRSRMARNPDQPNLRQVHLIHAELIDELMAKGFQVVPGDLGENILTRGIDLLGLPQNAVLRLGAEAMVQVTGLRNPCAQLNGHTPGLMDALISRAADGTLVRRGGVMGVVMAGGVVRAGNPIAIDRPAGPFEALAPV